MILSSLLLLAGCEGPVKPTAPPSAPAPAPEAPAAAAAAAPAPEPPALPSDTKRLATVAEVHAAGAYTILRMDACGAEAWVAGPKTDGLSVGQVLEMPLGTPMTDFRSKELDRTFDAILFVDWLRPTDARPECPKQKHHAEGQHKDPKAPSDVAGVVRETMESGGYRYARLDVCGVETWVAGPKVPLQIGETLLGDVSTEMTDFTSASLGRRFDRIVFLKRIAIGPSAPDCKGKGK